MYVVKYKETVSDSVQYVGSVISFVSIDMYL